MSNGDDSTTWPHVAPPVWDAIPPELATRQQWLLWKFIDKGEGKKPSKMPYYPNGMLRGWPKGKPRGGIPTEAQPQVEQGHELDRAELVDLATALRTLKKRPWFSGIGFAFLPDDGLIGIDIDGSINLENGVMTECCTSIINACSSYTEFSPSGKGVHIIVKGTTTTNKSDDIGLEVFCGRQFFTVTAQRYPDTSNDVTEIREGALKRLHATINEAKEKAKAARKAAAAPAAPPAAAHTAQQDSSGEDDFKRVNEAALAALHAWVPSLFAHATPYKDGYRCTSKNLGRDNQEDLSMLPAGIVDWGLQGTGDPKDGRRTPIDLVMEWSPATKPKDALHWLAQRIGIDLTPHGGRKQKPKKSKVPASAGNGGGHGGGGGDPPGSPPDDPDGEVDVYARLVKQRGRPMDCRENVMYCLQLDPALVGMVRQNDFTRLIERALPTPWGHPAGEWNEEDDLMLGEYLLRTWGLGIKATTTLRNGVLMAARSAKYNPVIDLIRAEPWDGVDRLDHWLTDVYEILERPYTRLIGRCFIMGLVKRAMQPGCKFDYMLIIKGEQGLQKSSAFRALAYPYFTDNAIRMGDKDSLMAMQLVWIAESAELESLNKSETTQIKQFLSSQEDMFRPPYGAQLIKAPRHAVNVGTTNADTFLRDSTGDRRFWPLEVHVVNMDVLKAHRAQLLAEALHRLEAGEQYWPTREQDKELVFPEHEPFKRNDTWEDMIDAYVNRDFVDKHDDPAAPVNAKRDFFTTVEIYERALLIKADRIDGAGNMDTRIGTAMKALHFEKYRETTGKRRRGFKRLPPPPPPATPLGAAVGPNLAPDAAGKPEEDDDLPI